MDFKKQKPIYLQIADRLMEQILSGHYAVDDRVPSVREVAASMGVNPNTVMRTFETLQDNNIIYNRRGVGYFVASDAKDKIRSKMRRDFFEDTLPAIRREMTLLGITIEEFAQYYDNNKPDQQS